MGTKLATTGLNVVVFKTGSLTTWRKELTHQKMGSLIEKSAWLSLITGMKTVLPGTISSANSDCLSSAKASP